MHNSIFNQNQMKKYINKYSLQITPEINKAINEWVSKLDKNELESEKNNYINFFDIILRDILGYSRHDILYEENIGREGRPVEFVLKKEDKKLVVVELKGTKTKDLDKRHGIQSPMEQATNYASIKEDTKWAIVSNFDEFRLFNPSYREKYISFNFKELIDENILKEFLLCFSKLSLIDKEIPQKLLEETKLIEEDIEDEFYKLFSETRLMLIKELEQDENNDREESIRLSQLILNRYIFCCFAEDIDLIPPETTTDVLGTPLKHGNLSKSKSKMWGRLNELFEFIDEGNEVRRISAFNGGLFKEDLSHLKIRDFVEDLSFFEDCYKKWSFEDKYEEIKEIIQNYKNVLNPIYKNLLVMSAFDFSSELDVNILGHIFENSIGDIEELKDQSKTRRKKDGVFYTPDYITDYICRNTIIPYLSKSGESTTVNDLISEYNLGPSELLKLDKKIKEIKIIDPACGSGAFLNKAADLLLEIHEKLSDMIYANRKDNLDYLWDSIDVRREILINNIYGVDINNESVDITKLAMFLKVAKKGLKLPNLDKNIKCGNSLIDNSDIAGDKAFNWEEEFKEVFDEGGFDVVIGNPPYVRVQEIPHNEIDYYAEVYEFTKGHVDLSILFIELANKLVKQDGLIGFITSNMFLTTNYGENIREFLTNNIKINQIVDFRDLKVFEDALTYVSIFIFSKSNPGDFGYYEVPDLDVTVKNVQFNKIKIDNLNKSPWNLKNHLLQNIFNKIKDNPKLNEGIGKCWYGIKTGLDKVLLFDDINDIKIEKEAFLKWVVASDCNRYSYCKASKFVIYPYKLVNDETKLLSAEEIKKEYPNLWQYLLLNKEELSNRKDSRKKVEDKWYKLVRQGNLSIFNKNKIVFPSLSKHHKFALGTVGEGYSGGSIFSITSESSEISIYYLLCLFNSNILESYLHSITPLKKGGYHSYSSTIIDDTPIPKISLVNQKPFIDNANLILNLNEECNKEIKSFNKWLIRTFEIDKLSKKLVNYYILSFDEFLKELKKKKVNTKQRKTQDLLETEFNESVAIIHELQSKIDETDSKINQLVYELYGLTEEEISIIEESLE